MFAPERIAVLGAKAFAATAFAAIALAAPALAQDAYVIGLTGALDRVRPPAPTRRRRSAAHLHRAASTRRAASTASKVNLVLQDDSAEPSKAAANAKKLITQDNVVLLINASLSSTYAPMLAEAKRAGVPLLFASSASARRKSTRRPIRCNSAPPPSPQTYDSRATLAFIKETAKEPVNVGFAAMAIPLSRGEIDFAESQAPDARHDRRSTRKSSRRRRPTTRRSPPSSRMRAPTGCSPGRRG